jgi:hypothetical protein
MQLLAKPLLLAITDFEDHAFKSFSALDLTSQSFIRGT